MKRGLHKVPELHILQALMFYPPPIRTNWRMGAFALRHWMGDKRKGEVQMRLLWLWLAKIMPTSSRQGQPLWRLTYREQLSVPRHASTMPWDKKFDSVEAIYLKKLNKQVWGNDEGNQNAHWKILPSMIHSSDLSCFKLTHFYEIKARLTETGLENWWFRPPGFLPKISHCHQNPTTDSLCASWHKNHTFC